MIGKTRGPRSELFRYAYGLSNDRRQAIWETICGVSIGVGILCGFRGYTDFGLMIFALLTIIDLRLVRRRGRRRELIVVGVVALISADIAWRLLS